MQDIGRNTWFYLSVENKSFSPERRTLRSGNFCHLKTCLWMSSHNEQPSEASETHSVEQTDEAGMEIVPGLIDARIKANLEPRQAQISTLTKKMIKLIQDNSAGINLTAGPRDQWFPSQSLLTEGPGSSKTLPLTCKVSVVYSPDSESVFGKYK